HRWLCTHAKDLSARTDVLGDAERFTQLHIIEPEQSSGDRGAREGVPRTRAVIIGDTFMQRDAGACADLITEDETGQKLRRAARGATVDCSEQRRQYRDAGVSFRQHMTVVGVERVD